MSEAKRRAKYTLEFKMEAVRLVKGGQACSVTAKILGIPKASLENWVRLNARGQLKGASSDKTVNPEQMELARLRAELNRPGFRGGRLVKVNQLSLSSRQVAESSLPQPRPVEYSQWVRVVGGD